VALAPDLVRREDVLEETDLLSIGPVRDEGRADEVQAEAVDRRRSLAPCVLLVEDDLLDEGSSAAAVLRRPVHREVPGLAELALPVAPEAERLLRVVELLDITGRTARRHVRC